MQSPIRTLSRAERLVIAQLLEFGEESLSPQMLTSRLIASVWPSSAYIVLAPSLSLSRIMISRMFSSSLAGAWPAAAARRR
jgi:hypothetical protein